MGKPRAITPVYEHNVREVLEIEAGHVVGLWDAILPRLGLATASRGYTPAARDRLDVGEDELYLGSFEIVPYAPRERPVDVYVQAHEGGVADLPGGQYRYDAGDLVRISGELIRRKDVIAINQQVYDRARFGISVVSRCSEDWLSYIELGRELQRLSMNGLNLGFMSAGYSSKTGRDLPSARRIDRILRAAGEADGPSYFFVGGRVSDEQVRSEGMKEDLVHAKGPAELITDDLAALLPDYMMPGRVVLLDRLPLTVSGKVDRTALRALDVPPVAARDRLSIAPRTATEERIVAIWRAELRLDDVSVHDDFFDLGGDSLLAVALINAIGEEFGRALPLQTLFDAPTVERLALRLDGAGAAQPASRLVPLHAEGSGKPIYCWPGLGGYTMNLRCLAGKLELDRPFYGVQAHGVNAGERPYADLTEMAVADMRLIRRLQPVGPYTLWGYSFGARVAVEVAHALELAGERVEHVLLIAPGSPRVASADASSHRGLPTFASRTYVTILFSVFAGSIADPALEACLELARDEESFAAFVSDRLGNIDPGLVRRIVAIVAETYAWAYASRGMPGRRVSAPISLFRARGDERSFTERGGRAHRTVVDLDADHYGVLKEPGVEELAGLIRGLAGAADRRGRPARRPSVATT